MPYKKAKYVHIKLQNKKKFHPKSFRTIDPGRKGGCTKVVIGCPANQYDTRAEKCRVGTQAQKVILEKECFGRNLPREIRKYKKTK